MSSGELGVRIFRFLFWSSTCGGYESTEKGTKNAFTDCTQNDPKDVQT